MQRALLLSDAAALDLRPYSGITFAPLQSAQTDAAVRRSESTEQEPRHLPSNGIEPRGVVPHGMEQRHLESAKSLPKYNDARACALSNFEQEYLRQLMSAAAGNVTRAAFMAGKERRTLGRLLKKYGI